MLMVAGERNGFQYPSPAFLSTDRVMRPNPGLPALLPCPAHRKAVSVSEFLQPSLSRFFRMHQVQFVVAGQGHVQYARKDAAVWLI